jgi:hypothetical protein
VALSLAEAQQLRADYYAALRAISTGQSYTIGQRTLTRADARFVEEQFEKYDALVDSIEAGTSSGARAFRVVPRDL